MECNVNAGRSKNCAGPQGTLRVRPRCRMQYQTAMCLMWYAQERIRTSTPLPALDPESSASASSATWALVRPTEAKTKIILRADSGFVNAARPALPAKPIA